MTVRCRVNVGPLVGPVLRRLVMALAAETDIPIDRAAEIQLAIELAATCDPQAMIGDHVELVGTAGDGHLDIRLGPFVPGVAAGMATDRRIPSPAALFAGTDDRLWTEALGDRDFLHVAVRSVSPVETGTGVSDGALPK